MLEEQILRVYKNLRFYNISCENKFDSFYKYF